MNVSDVRTKHCDFCKLIKTADCICACHTAKVDIAQLVDPQPQFDIPEPLLEQVLDEEKE